MSTRTKLEKLHSYAIAFPRPRKNGMKVESGRDDGNKFKLLQFMHSDAFWMIYSSSSQIYYITMYQSTTLNTAVEDESFLTFKFVCLISFLWFIYSMSQIQVTCLCWWTLLHYQLPRAIFACRVYYPKAHNNHFIPASLALLKFNRCGVFFLFFWYFAMCNAIHNYWPHICTAGNQKVMDYSMKAPTHSNQLKKCTT